MADWLTAPPAASSPVVAVSDWLQSACRLHGMQEVVGSNPIGSIPFPSPEALERPSVAMVTPSVASTSRTWTSSAIDPAWHVWSGCRARRAHWRRLSRLQSGGRHFGIHGGAPPNPCKHAKRPPRRSMESGQKFQTRPPQVSGWQGLGFAHWPVLIRMCCFHGGVRPSIAVDSPDTAVFRPILPRPPAHP